MDKWQAQDTYWNSFGLPAYNELTVREDAVMPYITYQATTGSIDGVMTVSGNLWYRGNSWAAIMQKATAMEPLIDRQIKIDGGYVKFRKPIANFAQPMSDANDKQVRRILLTVEVEFLSE